ncbi:MAG: SGNH/GDSL hydrolase family protein [Planctomycetes bacterium]|nr:SGNH/GDSL hydrolase family protein [Planctomycetota bacterium]
MDASPDPRLLRAQRALLAVSIVAIGALVAVVLLALRPARGVPFRAAPLPPNLAERIAALPGVMDSHPDPDVGRVLLPLVDGQTILGHPLHTNAQGMRDAQLVSPKPRGTVRIVFLGDSFVFGWGVDEDERVGAVLQRELSARSDGRHAFDVRHVAVPSWNTLNEVAYMRRRLSLYEPDLVVLVLCSNDLDDGAGVRGFGELATFDPARPRRADGRLSLTHGALALGSTHLGLLDAALDDESRARWAATASALGELDRAVTAVGAKLRVLVQCGTLNMLAARAFADLDPRLFLWLPMTFSDDPARRVSADDWHWSALAHGEVAQLVYGVIRSQQLLPYDVDVGPWAESGRALEELHRKGAAEVERPVEPERLLAGAELEPALDFDRGLTDQETTQVHGGVDALGRLGPFAALVLRNPGASTLHVELSGLGRREMAEVGLRIDLDEVTVHEGRLGADARWTLELPVPEALRGRAHLGVRFVADDWLASPEDDRHAVVATLHGVALRP